MAALIALVSGLLWGAADFAGGLASRRLPTLAVVGWSQIIALLALLVAVAATGAWRTVWPPDTWLLWGVAAGLAGVGGLVCFYRALAVGTMGVVSPIAALGVVVPVLASFVQGERPARLQLAGMVLALTGAIAASGPELSGGPGRSATGGPGSAAARQRRDSLVLAALTGLLFGLALFFMAQGSAAGPLLTVTSMRLVSLVIFVTTAMLARTLGGVGRADLPLLVAIGVGDALANVLYGIASTMGLVSVVAVLGSLYPVVTVLLARLVLHERMQPVQAAGVGVAMTGVALIAAG